MYSRWLPGSNFSQTFVALKKSLKVKEETSDCFRNACETCSDAGLKKTFQNLPLLLLFFDCFFDLRVGEVGKDFHIVHNCSE